MDVDSAVDIVALHLAQMRGAALSKHASQELRERIRLGRELALHERDEAAFDAAVVALSQQVGQTVLLAAMEGGENQAVITSHSLDMALRDLCPLWPFC